MPLICMYTTTPCTTITTKHIHLLSVYISLLTIFHDHTCVRNCCIICIHIDVPRLSFVYVIPTTVTTHVSLLLWLAPVYPRSEDYVHYYAVVVCCLGSLLCSSHLPYVRYYYIFSLHFLSQFLELFGRVPTHSCIQTHTYVQTDIRLMIYIRIETKDDDERTKDILNKKKQIIYRIVL